MFYLNRELREGLNPDSGFHIPYSRFYDLAQLTHSYVNDRQTAPFRVCHPLPGRKKIMSTMSKDTSNLVVKPSEMYLHHWA